MCPDPQGLAKSQLDWLTSRPRSWMTLTMSSNKSDPKPPLSYCTGPELSLVSLAVRVTECNWKAGNRAVNRCTCNQGHVLQIESKQRPWIADGKQALGLEKLSGGLQRCSQPAQGLQPICSSSDGANHLWHMRLAAAWRQTR